MKLSTAESGPSSRSSIDKKVAQTEQNEKKEVEYGYVEIKRKNIFARFYDSLKPGVIQAPEIDPTTGLAVVKGDDTAIRRADEVDENGGLMKRDLKGRHVQMIAIGGAIGTGLFVGSGKVLNNGGPASLVISFTVMGLMLYCTVNSLAELSIAFPIQGSFSVYSTRFIDPAWGFAMGWNYTAQWLVAFATELVAASMIMGFWDTGVSNGVYIAVFLVLLVGIAMLGVKGFGEIEFVFCWIKVLAVCGFMILGIIIICGGTGQGYLGAHTWYDPGAFNNGLKGFCAVFTTAAFAFNGTELVGLAASECENPRKSIGRASRTIVWRIMLFYVVNLLLVGLIIPYNDPQLLSGNGAYDSKASPFVLSIVRAHIKFLPHLFNAIILIAVLSVGNASIYCTSRVLAALAGQKQAPAIFKYIDRRGRPLPGIIFSGLAGCIAFGQLGSKGTDMFDWLSGITGLSALITWGSINFAYIRFRHAMKMQSVSSNELAFHSQVKIPGAIVGIVIVCLVVIGQFYISLFPIGAKPSAEAFFKGFLSVIMVLVFFWFWKLLHWKSQHYLRLKEIDLYSGRRIVDREKLLRQDREEQAKRSFIGKIVHVFI